MTCNEELKAENKPYPRTCAACGIGPCSENYEARYRACKGQVEREMIIEELRHDIPYLHRLLRG